MPAPLYDVLLLCHIAAAFIGFGSVAVGGYYAAAGRHSPRPAAEEALRRFFQPGVDWAGRLIFLVPLLGLAMLLGGDRSDLPSLWPWLGLFLWAVACGVLTARGWPAERRAQGELAVLARGEGGDVGPFRQACKEMERASVVATFCFLVVVALMIWQP